MPKADAAKKEAVILLIIAHDQTRQGLLSLLQENSYTPAVLSDLNEVVNALKDQEYATVLVDCEAVATFGAALHSRIKVVCPTCRVILFCDKSHRQHQKLLKEAMELGAYACLLAPYKDLEVLTMVRHSLARKPSRKGTPKRGGAARHSG